MKRRGYAVALLLCACALAVEADDAPSLVEAAGAFIAALDNAEAADANWPFDDPERTDVHYAPIGLDGLRHGDLEAATHDAGETLLAATLSDVGYSRVREIRLLERDVREQEIRLLRPFGLRDPGRYFFAFFGTPSASRPWAFRYEGHHLSINVTAVPGSAPASTPLFLGAQPRLVPEGLPSAGVAALGEEERLARALYAMLDGEQRAAATLAYLDDRGHMIGQVARVDALKPVGLSRAGMTADQQALLEKLLERFAGFWSEPIAAARRADIAAARDALHFAFVAADDPRSAFYCRVAGGALLLEIDNTEGGDHVHAVWHQRNGDFGRDPLARHLAEAHGKVLARSVTDRP